MARNIIFIPIGKSQDIKSVILFYAKTLYKNRHSFSFFKPIIENNNINRNKKETYYYLKKLYDVSIMKSIFVDDFLSFLNKEKYVSFLEKILDLYSMKNNKEFVLIEGISYSKEISINFFNQLNLDIANILNSEIIFVITLKSNFIEDFFYKINFINHFFKDKTNSKNLGIIINFSNNYSCKKEHFFKNFLCNTKNFFLKKKFSKKKLLCYKKLDILCIFFENEKKILIDRKILLKELLVKEKHYNKMKTIFINLVILYHKKDQNIQNFLKRNTLLIVYSSNFLFLKNIYLFLKKNNIFLSILIIKDNKFNFYDDELYINLKKIGVSIFTTFIDNFTLFYSLIKINYLNNKHIFKKKYKKINVSIISDKFFSTLNSIKNLNQDICSYKFLYQLKKMAKKFKKTIIFPEGENEKIIQAVYLCHKLDICHCILFGNPNVIHKKAKKLNLFLPEEIKIYNPQLLINDYIDFFSKNYQIFDINQCKKLLQENNLIISTILLKKFSKYHGLVAGIENTTASVIRPALKLIKMKKNIKLISSIFFMLFEKKVLVYGDCAINPNPSALDLSEIAIQSADSAKLFGIFPKIAMLSYSTNDSGSGFMVEKVQCATDLVRKKRPDLIIEGPIQYDAATNFSVSKIKCPNSKIIGQANVFIFPDLNSGNITYKAVQRSSSIISIGPVIQGLNKPINDLSRGASVKDILYTIIVTAIQSHKK